MMKNKGKKLVVLLLAACMILTMFSSVTVSAATDAEIFATTNTIKKESGKYYYVNASGKTDKKIGWKKVAGKYTYYVGKNGNITAKITGGKYYKWNNGKWKKQSLKKNSTKKIYDKVFYVNKNGKIVKQTGWKKTAGKYTYYIGKNGNVTAKITGGKYYKWNNGKWKKQSLKKNSTKKIYGKVFYVNKNGKIVKQTGWKKTAGKYTYYIGKNGNVTAKITGGKYYKWSNGKWKKQSVKDAQKEPATEKPTTETTTEKVTTEETTTEESTTEATTEDEKPEAHVCKWKPITENGEAKQFNYKEHAEVKVTENQVVAVAWDEPVYEERIVCRTCGEIFPTEKMDGGAAWINHVLTTNHGNSSLENVQVDTIHHPEERADVEVVKERAYSEWDQKFKCTVCGDIMTEHVVCGDTDSEHGECAFILDKSGDLLYSTGEFRKTVSSGTYYGVFYDAVKDSKYTDYLQLLKDHGFIK